MFNIFKRKSKPQLRELLPDEPLFTIVDVKDEAEDCVSYVEVETYYKIRNNMSGKTKWVNKRFIHEYGL